MRQLLAITALLLGCISMGAQTKNNEMKYNKIQVEDCNVFYREAGSPEKPAILLLHGFPSSSHMFRELMPDLADEYLLITTMSASQAAPRCRMTSFSTIARTLPSTLSFRNTSVLISPHCWLSGERTTLRSSLKVPKPSSATYPMPKSISYPAVTLLSKATTPR